MPTERNRGAADILLDPNGEKQIHAISKKFAATGTPPDRIFTSDRGRAVQTANIIASHTGAKVQVDPDLNPWPMGDLEGKRASATKPTVDALRTTHDSSIPPGLSPYPSLPAESHSQYSDRYLKGLDKIMQEHEVNPYQRDMLVTHGSDIRTTKAWARAGFPPDHTLDAKTLLQDDSSPGDSELLHQHPDVGWTISKYEPGSQTPEPYGIYLQRHGETPWNS